MVNGGGGIPEEHFTGYRGWECLGQGTHCRVYSVPQEVSKLFESRHPQLVVRVPRKDQRRRSVSVQERNDKTLAIFKKMVRTAIPQSEDADKISNEMIRQGSVAPLGVYPAPASRERFYNSDIRNAFQVLKLMREEEATPLIGIEEPPVVVFPIEKGRISLLCKKYQTSLEKPLPRNADRAKVSTRLLHGLYWLLKKRVLHLDLHLSNCLTEGSDAVISDFGKTMILPPVDMLKSLEQAKIFAEEMSNRHIGRTGDLPFNEFLVGSEICKDLNSANSLGEFKALYEGYIRALQPCQVFLIGKAICGLYGATVYFRDEQTSSFRNCPSGLQGRYTSVIDYANYEKSKEAINKAKDDSNRLILDVATDMIHYDKDKRPKMSDIQELLDLMEQKKL